MIPTLIPVFLAVALLVAALTGHLPFEQLLAGLGLLLAPGADRFAPLLREVLGRVDRGERRVYSVGGAVNEDLIERLAQALHEAGRAAVERGLTVGRGPQVFVTWPQISEDAREGRRVQARALLAAGWQPPRAARPALHPGELALFLLALGALGTAACYTASRHTAGLRELQHQAVLRCRASAAACPAARSCAAAAVRASEAWVALARLKEADAKHRAGQGAPVNLVQVVDQEQQAQRLEAEATTACTPAAGVPHG